MIFLPKPLKIRSKARGNPLPFHSFTGVFLRHFFLLTLVSPLFLLPLHAETAPPPESEWEENDGWFREITVKAREYRRLYHQTRQAYEGLRATYETLSERYRDLDRKLTLQKENLQEYQLLLQSEREAWQRLYQEPSPTSPGRVDAEETDTPPPGFLDLPEFDFSREAETEGSLWERLRYRYQLYRDRYESLAAAYQALHLATRRLEEENQRLHETSTRLEKIAAEPQRQWQEERKAWERLYRE
ncbi:MAG: hypothetical protein JJT75_04490 [Opitutales bacterium]|nr:hypothetical protein [Opitutales bacterium]MCH8541652.1 hypothetical protein [Opitutales bacterium]